MKTLYIECNMGAAGDMLMAALLELVPDKEAFIAKMNSLGLPGVELSAGKVEKCGIVGTHVTVRVGGEEEFDYDEDHGHHRHHDHEHGEGHEHHHHEQEHEHHHSHRSQADILAIIDGLDVSDKVKADAAAVYKLIAEAESAVHGREVSEIHFHEVGTMDALADVVGVCLLMEQIGADRIAASAVHVGSGTVRCAHGVLPVPAPATAYILKGVPIYGGRVWGELCTPTGAALLKHFASSFGEMPAMKVEAIGGGMGSRDFEQANVVRAFLGEEDSSRDEIIKLECNIDDMTGEDLGFAIETLLESGARDVFTQAIGMKKNRPGVLLSVICSPQDADRMAALMLKHTTTIGVRRQDMRRYVLTRSQETVQTELGTVRIKNSEGYGVKRSKAEFADLAKIAKENGLSIEEARALLPGLE